MDVIQEGVEEVKEMAAVNCCWPPGTMNMHDPVDE